MQTAINLTAAIETLVKARKQTANVVAIWSKLDRAVQYLNDQLALELSA